MAEINTVREMLAQTQAMRGPNPTLEEMRAGYNQAGQAMPMAPDVSVEEVTLGGIAGLRLTPPTADTSRTVLYFHGGGYMIGSPAGHRAMVSHIAAAAGATAWSMDYRMAPEAPFPAAVEDGVAAYKALLDAGIAASDIIIAGDSAGGGLTLATALKARSDGLTLPAGLVLLSPWVDLEGKGWSHEAKTESDPMIDVDGINGMATAYANGNSLSDPLISPIHANLKGLPPLLIQVGSEEVLLSDSTTLAERAGGAGVAVTLEVWPDMIHVFQFFHGQLSDARLAITGIGDWISMRTA